ncbi:unnamed protein product [Periconia digitata]|uniref:Uncharacterized protein n=1 Tax=Periconia digitata TaxID=1303443 RepID=A0A9W4XR87_9PLEO|nr:unnamed protein product [Periconia digitata]
MLIPFQHPAPSTYRTPCTWDQSQNRYLRSLISGEGDCAYKTGLRCGCFSQTTW